MDMRCLVNLHPTEEQKTLIIEAQLEEVIKYYHVPQADREKFFNSLEIRILKEVLRSVNMSADEMADYLGKDFALKWKRGGEDEG